MSDIPGPPGPPGPDDPPGGSGDAWDAWRQWSPGEGAETGAWDAWKSWEWTPRPAGRMGFSASSGRKTILAVVIGVAVTALIVLSILFTALGEPEHLKADEIIAGIDALAVTGTRDQRPPDASVGETATFPAPGVDPASVARDIVTQVKIADRTEASGGSVYLLYEEGTVVIAPASDGVGSEVVVFEDNKDATGRFPLLLAVPGWSSSLDTFDSRAQSRGGVGGFRGGGSGGGK